jgi:hypothetical protein
VGRYQFDILKLFVFHNDVLQETFRRGDFVHCRNINRIQLLIVTRSTKLQPSYQQLKEREGAEGLSSGGEGVNLISFMIVLRIITPDLFLLLKNVRPFEFVDTKLNPPFLALGKHTQRFMQIESSRAKKTQLLSVHRPQKSQRKPKEAEGREGQRGSGTRVESSVLSTYPALCTTTRNLSSLVCCSIVKFPRCLN